MANAQPSLGLAAERDERTEAVESQVGRIVGSPIFRNSPVLQSFLTFITDRALHGRESEINEYAIATQVFARGADFDPSVDTIVRTQAYRLRSKLQQYYATLGSGDPVVIQIPKGHYVPAFICNEPDTLLPAVECNSAPPVTTPYRWWKVALLVAMALGLISIGWFAGNRNRAAASGKTAKTARVSPLEAFWLGFLESDRQPIVAFTNAQFLGTDSGDLLRFSGGAVADRGAVMEPPAGARGQKGRLYYQDDYTGVGEVLAAVAVSNALSPVTGPLLFKRSHLVTAYDLQHHNLVFLGSPVVNRILYDVPQPQHFIFRSARTPARLWRSAYENVNPAAGEPRSYQIERDPATGVLRADYATVSVLPGIAPGRRILVAGGLSTSGTQGAAEMISTPQGLAELARALAVTEPGDPAKWPQGFEVVLRVELSRGLDVIQVHPVASRITQWKK